MRDLAVRLITGAFAEFPADEEVGRYLLEGWYEAQEQSFVHQYLRAGDVFLDVGAHAGLYSAIASARVGADGRVIAVEPNTDILPHLERNLGAKAEARLAPARTGAAILAAALSDADGEAAFAAEGIARSAYASLDFDGGASMRVPTRSLDSLRAEGALGRIDLMKVDVEGAEHLVLEGARETIAASPEIAILMEFTESNRRRFGGSTADLAALARSLGLDLARIDMVMGTFTPVRDAAPLWHENLLLAHDFEHVRARLSAADAATKAISADFARKGAANHRRYAESEALRRLTQDLRAHAGQFDSLRALATGAPSTDASARGAAAAADKEPVAAAEALSRWLTDELARVEGDFGGVAAALKAARGRGLDPTLFDAAALALGAAQGRMTGAPDAAEACRARLGAADGSIAWLADEIGRLDGMVRYQIEQSEKGRAELRASRNEVRAMGDLALALRRSRVIGLCAALRLKPAALTKRMIAVFTAEDCASAEG